MADNSITTKITIDHMYKNCPKPDGWFGCFATMNRYDTIKLTGKVSPGIELQNGMTLECELVHVKENEYKATAVTIVTKTMRGILAYLTSKNFKNIGMTTARKIYAEFGNDSITMIEKDPDEVQRRCSLSDKQIESLKAGVSNVSYENTLRKMIPMLTAKQAERLKESGITLDEILKNPYILLEVEGFTFSVADNIALNHVNIPFNDSHRIEEGICYTLFSTLKLKGDLFINLSDDRQYDEFLDGVNRLLSTSLDRIGLANYLYNMQKPDAIMVKHMAIPKHPESEQTHLYHAATYDAQEHLRYILAPKIKNQEKSLSNIIKMTPTKQILDLIQKFENGHKIRLTDEQKDAVICVLKNSVSAITGGPGCGKTEVLNCINFIHRILYSTSDEEVKFLAPTGKALNKLKNTLTNLSSSTSTVASFLMERRRAAKTIKVTKMKSMVLHDHSLIIVDESSMLNIMEAAELCDYAQKCQICFVGDVDQLPSIEPGQFLYDIIEALDMSQNMPTTKRQSVARLTQSFRANMQEIKANADCIKNGITKLKWTPNFLMYPQMADDETYADYVVDCYVSELQTHDINEIIILTPSRKGMTGDRQLNMRLQEKLNPKASHTPFITNKNTKSGDLSGRKFTETKGYEIEETYYACDANHYTRFRIGDRIMWTKNHYDANWWIYEDNDIRKNAIRAGNGVFNGDCGTLIRYYAAGGEDLPSAVVLQMDDGRVFHIMAEDTVGEMALAYATTVHKSQGSEYEVVIFSSQASLMFMPEGFATRNLLYTAITRAKEQVFIIGSKASFEKCILTKREKRQSELARYLFEDAVKA